MIPERTRASIDRYVADHVEPGGFVRAVLENNLKESFGRADSENREALFDIVCYCYNEVPLNCWGSPDRVQKWLDSPEVEIIENNNCGKPQGERR